MDEQRPWHRLFGLSWIDFFRGMPVTVELEKDLSLKKQLLDLLLIRTEFVPLPCRLPDGFEVLGPYNLISFKSLQEKLSVWTLLELIGHFVNYRKQVSPSMDEAGLLPEDQFRLFAVTARYPQQLAATPHVDLRPVQEGVYEVHVLGRAIRIVVLNQLPLEEHNAMLHLFSTRGELLLYAARHYRVRSVETSTLVKELFKKYQQEVRTMGDLLEEFTRQAIDNILKEVPLEKRLEGLSPQERLKGLTPDEVLAALPPEMRKALAERLKANGST